MATRPKDEAGGDLGWRAHLIEDAIFELVDELWGNATRRDDILDAYDWNSDPEISQVHIAKEHHPEWENANLDLEFVIQAGDTDFVELHQKDYLKQRGADIYRKFVAATPVAIKCISENSEHAHMAAAEVAIRLREIDIRVERDNNWRSFDVPGYKAPQSMNEGGGPPYVSVVPMRVEADMDSILPAR